MLHENAVGVAAISQAFRNVGLIQMVKTSGAVEDLDAIDSRVDFRINGVKAAFVDGGNNFGFDELVIGPNHTALGVITHHVVDMGFEIIDHDLETFVVKEIIVGKIEKIIAGDFGIDDVLEAGGDVGGLTFFIGEVKFKVTDAGVIFDCAFN